MFIKTYPGDVIWLEYCIKSIEKFVTGFRDIVIVTDSGTELKIDSNLPIKIFYEDLPNEIHPCPVGIGYAWAQSVKLNWTKYTDADYILQIDSDTMFTNNIDMSYYHIDGKIKWFYREWSESGEGIIHRVPTDFFIKRESTRDHMPAPTWFFSRKTTDLFQNWVNEEVKRRSNINSSSSFSSRSIGGIRKGGKKSRRNTRRRKYSKKQKPSRKQTRRHRRSRRH